ncbi:right-handed parallel beta-helix repeat-containing protein [Candidatus Pacearchaeota archaeon]|nr:right-handed parallel beta-helix repeat-containing protein [Candidatus Pacearchaeota archaeon]
MRVSNIEMRGVRYFIFLGIFLSIVIFGVVGVDAADCGGEVRCNCGDTLVFSQVMDYDINCGYSQDGLIIQGYEPVTLDCNGHYLRGLINDDLDSSGITVNSPNSVIKNCNIEDFNTGVLLNFNDNLLINNVVEFGNLFDFEPSYGFRVENSHRNTLQDNRILRFSYAGLSRGIYLAASSDNIIRGNSIELIGGENMAVSLDRSSTRNIITNNNITYAVYGVKFDGASRNQVVGNSITSTVFGIFFTNYTENTENVIRENEINESSYFDIEFYKGGSPITCDNIIEDNIGSGGRPIKFFNSQVNLENERVSELILCNADNSIINNVIIEGSNSSRFGGNNGMLILNTDDSIFSNINSSGNFIGFYLENSKDNVFENIIANDNTLHENDDEIVTSHEYQFETGLYLARSFNNTIVNGSFNSNYKGVQLENSRDNLLVNSTVSLNRFIGVYTFNASDRIIGNVINSNGGIGLLISGKNNIIDNNNISNNNGTGIWVSGFISNDYNNITNNVIMNNKKFFPPLYGNGVLLYYSNSNNILNNTISFNDLNGIYLLGLQGYGGSNNNSIYGNIVNENNKSGIFLENSDYNNITNNNVFNNTESGIYLYNGISNRLINNTLNFNIKDGITFFSSSYNVLVNNTVKKNKENGVVFESSSYNNATRNIVCFNNMTDITRSGGSANLGINNTCDFAQGWDDFNKTGCSLKCTPVLLAHGIYADDSVWGTMELELEKEGYKVFRVGEMLGLPGFTPSNGDIKGLTRQLNAAIKRVKIVTGVEKIDIVAHSQGGLESRWYIQKPLFGNDVRKLIMLSTPNHGSDLSLLRKSSVNAVSVVISKIVALPPGGGIVIRQALQNTVDNLVGPSAIQMEPHSVFLAQLNSNIYSAIHSSWPVQFPRDDTFPPPPNGVYYYNIEGTGWPTVVHTPFMINIPFIGEREIQRLGIHNSGDFVVHVDSMDLFSRDRYVPNTEIPGGFHFVTPPFVESLGLVGMAKHPDVIAQVKRYLAFNEEMDNRGSDLPIEEEPLPVHFPLEIESLIVEGDRNNHSLSVDSTIQKMAIIHIWQNFSDLPLTLITPSKEIINISNYGTFPNVNYTKNNMISQVYEISDPEPGEWVLLIEGVNVSGVESYTITTVMETLLFTGIGTNNYTYKANEQVKIIGVTLFNTTVIDSNISVEITKPNNDVIILPLFDDGLHDDGYPGDAIFGNNFSDTSIEGGYIISSLVDGNYEGFNFTREGFKTFTVEKNSDLAILNLTFSDESPMEWEIIEITAEIKNLGGQKVSNISVFFFDGLPYEDGVLIGESPLFDIVVNQTINTNVSWSPYPTGAHMVYAILSPFADFIDTNPGNDIFNRTIIVRVNQTNSPPILDPIGNQEVRVNENLMIDLNATDPDNDTLTYFTNAREILPKPNAFSFAFTFDSAQGLFNWTPLNDAIGNYNVTFNVTDGELWDEETIVINVTN